MRPRMGARRAAVWLAALTLGFGLAGAAAARADDGVTLTRFKLPDRAAVDKLNAMGANHLVNGAYALPQELQVKNSARAYQPIPAGVHLWGAPTNSEDVPLEFKQSIGSGDGLRTGSYSKTLTFTRSTTTP